MTLPTRPLRFVRGNRLVSIDAPAPDAMVLDWLRAEGGHGTREGCGEGDCGACAVVVGELRDGALQLRAVNSCIRLLSSLDGCALFTVEDLSQGNDALHPVQQALLDSHGSQCGFCTPGFVMSLFALYHEAGAQAAPGCIDRARAQTALSGNLCRCTGYRPILDAAQTLHRYPVAPLDEAALSTQLQALQSPQGVQLAHPAGITWRPATLDEALQCRAQAPAAQVVAGTTDVGLWINKQHLHPARVIDLSATRELQGVHIDDRVLKIGAATRLTDAFTAIATEYPAVTAFLGRFAGLPVRNAATLGGNIVNGSPIGDSMPLLMALDARLTLASMRGAREIALADFYTGYRRHLLAPDELLVSITIPRAQPDQLLRTWKVAKRLEDDISALALAVCLRRTGDVISDVRIGVGGMAAMPSRAPRTEAALMGRPWQRATLEAAADTLRAEFTPLSDLRASASYRATVIGNLLLRLWHETQGEDAALQDIAP